LFILVSRSRHHKNQRRTSTRQPRISELTIFQIFGEHERARPKSDRWGTLDIMYIMDETIKSGIIGHMAKREFTLTEAQRNELIRAYDQATAVDVQRRVQAVRLYGEGRSVQEIREIVGCSERSLRRWCAWYEQGGLERLEDQRAGGNNAKLTPEQRATVIERVKTYRPDQLLPAEVRISRGEFWTVSDL
jgi:transposase